MTVCDNNNTALGAASTTTLGKVIAPKIVNMPAFVQSDHYTSTLKEKRQTIASLGNTVSKVQGPSGGSVLFCLKLWKAICPSAGISVTKVIPLLTL